jgi:hypothetical protein
MFGLSTEALFGHLQLINALVVLASFTYTSGLRAFAFLLSMSISLEGRAWELR